MNRRFRIAVASFLVLALGIGFAGLAAAQSLVVENPTSATGTVGLRVEVSNGTSPFAASSNLGNLTFNIVVMRTATNQLEVLVGTKEANDTIKTDASGNFRASFVLPDAPFGGRTIAFGGRQVSFSIVGRIVTPPAFSLTIGDDLNLVAKGFVASKKVDVKVAGIKQYDVTADGNGTVTVTSGKALAEAPYGLNDLTLVSQDNASNTASIANAVFVNPKVTDPATSVSATIGGEVQVKGKGFPRSSLVTFTAGGESVATTTTTNANGSFDVKIIAPALSGAVDFVYDIRATAGGVAASAAGKLRADPQVTSVSSSIITFGQAITINGTGFGVKRDSNGNITGGSTVKAFIGGLEAGSATASIASGSKGNVTVSATVPALAPTTTGTVTIELRDDNTAGALSATKDITYSLPDRTRVIAVDQATRTVGASVKVTGFGYPANTNVGKIRFGATTTGDDIVTGADGSFQRTVSVPQVIGAAYTINTSLVNADQGQGPAGTPLPTVTVVPGNVTRSPANGVKDALITVTGDGFGNAEGVTVTVGSQSFTTDNAGNAIKASASGVLSAVVKLGDQTNGAKDVSVLGQTSARSANTGDNKFTVLEQVSSVSPANGSTVAFGSPVTITGTGWRTVDASDNGKVLVKTGDLTLATVISQSAPGTWSTTFTVPNLAAGAFGITATQGGDPVLTQTTLQRGAALSYNIKSVSDAFPIASVAPTTVTEGTTVTVRGNGLTANKNTATNNLGALTFRGEQVTAADWRLSGNIVGGTGATKDHVTTDANGAFVVTFAVPPGKPAGAATVALGGSSVSITVKPKITAATTGSKKVGENIIVGGVAFGSNESLTITMAGVDVAANVVAGSLVADAGGQFNVTFRIPEGGAASTAGTKTIKLVSASTGTDGLSVTGPSVVPSITLAPTAGFKDDTVTVSGNGFGASEGVTLTFDGGSGTQVFASAVGVLQKSPTDTAAATFKVPAAGQGAHEVKARGNVSGLEVTASFTVNHKATLTPVAGTNDTNVTISGEGFQPGETISVTFSGSAATTAQSGSFTVGSNGSFSVVIKVGVDTAKQTRGLKDVVVKGGTSNRQAIFGFDVRTRITGLSISTAKVGDSFTVTGDGFAGSSNLTATAGGQAAGDPDTQEKSASNGTISATFTVPNLRFGEHTVTVTDASANAATSSGKIAVSGKITELLVDGSKTKQANVGSTVTVKGTGFHGNPTVKLGGADVSETYVSAPAGANGVLEVTFPIDPQVFGLNKAVELTDTNDPPQKPTATGARTDDNKGVGGVDVVAKITPSVTTAPTTGSLTLTGTGFQGGVNVNFTIAGVLVGNTTSASNGNFTGTVNIPSTQAAGSAAIVASDGVASASTTVVVSNASTTTRVQFSDNTTSKSAKPGDKVTIVGTGYPAGAVALTIGGATPTLDSGSLTADANGAFSATVFVPDLKSGNQAVATTPSATSSATVVVQPKLSLSIGEGKVGDPITVTGRGYNPDEELRVNFGGLLLNAKDAVSGAKITSVTALDGSGDLRSKTDGNVTGPFKAASNGGWIATIDKVPVLPFLAGKQTVSDSAGRASASFEVEGQITSSGYNNAVKGGLQKGDTLTVTGNGWQAGEIVNITYGSQTGTGVAASDGTFSATLTLGDQTNGAKDIKVLGASSGRAGNSVDPKQTGMFTVLTKLDYASGSATSGVKGTSVTLAGSGFAKTDDASVDAQKASIRLAGNEIKKIVVASNGGFTETFTTIDAGGGAQTLSVVDRNANTASVSFVVTARITSVKKGDNAASAGVNVGDTIKVKGDGFGSSQAVQWQVAPTGTSSFTTEATLGTASATGVVSEPTFTMPAKPSGTYDLRLISASASATLSGAIVVNPKVSVSPSTGTGGTSVTLTGSGYTAGATVLATFDGVAATIATGGTAGSDGSINATTNVPTLTSNGSKTVAVTAGVRASTSFLYGGAAGATSSVTLLNGPSFKVGDTAKLRGTGFPASTNLGRLLYKVSGADDASGDPALDITVSNVGSSNTATDQVVTDQQGLFEVDVAVPEKVGGNYVVRTEVVSALARPTFSIAKKLTVSGTNALGATLTLTGTGYAATTDLGKPKYGSEDRDATAGAKGTVTSGAVKTDANGSLVVTITVPTSGANTFAGTHTVNVGGATADHKIKGAVAITSVSPTTGVVATLVTVQAKALTPNDTIKVKFAGGDVGSTTSNASGEITHVFAVPLKVKGAYDIAVESTAKIDDAVQSATNAGAFTVTQGNLVLSPSSAEVGAAVEVTGNGFAAGTISVAGVNGTLANTTIGSDGRFAATLTVGNNTFGSKTLTFMDSSGNPATGTLSILTKLTVSPTEGTIAVPSPTAGSTTSVTVTGSGFPDGENITVTLGSQTLGVATASSGAFTVGPVALTAQGGGAKDVKAAAATTNDADKTKAGGFTIKPTIAVQDSDGDVNANLDGDFDQAVTVAGTGFVASGKVNVTIRDTAATDGSNKDVNSSGSFGPITVKVPAVAVGATKLKVTDTAGTAKDIDFVVNTTSATVFGISLSVDNGTIGTLVTVNGVGFQKASDGSQQVVNIKFQGNTAASATTVHSVTTVGGAFAASFAIPLAEAGAAMITAEAASVDAGAPAGLTQKSSSKTFTVKPAITSASPSAVRPGERLLLVGNGFLNTTGAAENPTVLLQQTEDANNDPFKVATDLSVANTALGISTTTIVQRAINTDGTMLVEITLPTPTTQYPDPNNDGRVAAKVKIVDQNAKSAEVAFTIVLTSAPSSFTARVSKVDGTAVASGVQAVATADQTVTVSGEARDGAGLPLRNSNLGIVQITHSFVGTQNVSVASHSLAAVTGSLSGDSVVTNENGDYAVSFKLSTATASMPGGIVTITVKGATTTVDVKGKITVPTQVRIGQAVQITGSGYVSNAPITVKYGVSGSEAAITTTPATVTASATGTFTATATIPAGAGGARRFLATDNRSTDPTVAPGVAATTTVVPTLTAPAAAVSLGVSETLTLSGNGFAASEALTITVGTVTVTDGVTGGTTNANGTFEVKFPVPVLTSGTYTVALTAPSGASLQFAQLTVTPSAAIASVAENSAGATLKPGDVLAVTVTQLDAAVTAASGTVSVGNVKDVALVKGDPVEGQPAVWTASITVAAGNVAKAEAVKATLTDAAGKRFSKESTTTVTIDAVADIGDITVAVANDKGEAVTVARVGGKVTVKADIETGASATFSIAGVAGATDVAMPHDPDRTAATGFHPVIGTYTVGAEDNVADAVVTVKARDALGNVGTKDATTKVTLDNKVAIAAATVAPTEVRNGISFTLTVTTETGATVTADVSAVDTTQTAAVAVAETTTKGTFSATVAVSADNKAESGDKTIAVTVKDAAGNTVTQTVAIRLQNETTFALSLHEGLNLIHVPVSAPTVKRLSDLFTALGGATDVNVVVGLGADGKFQAFTPNVVVGSAADVALTPTSGAIAIMKRAKVVSFTGAPLAETVALAKGLNLIGVPRSGAVAKVSGLAGKSAKVTIVIYESAGKIQSYSKATGAVDTDVTGGQGFIVVATDADTLTLAGSAWSKPAAAAPATPVVARTDSTPVFVVEGALAREDNRSAVNGVEATVTNLRTGATAQNASGSVSGNGRYLTTFVMLSSNEDAAFRVGDTVELRVSDPSGTFGGVQPMRHVLTVEDIRRGRLSLESILLSVVPEQSALLPNFPNPFNPETWIPFQLSESATVRITIYAPTGEVVRSLDLGNLPAGSYTTRSKAAYWDGTNQVGERVASGLYLYRIEAGSFSAMRRMVILK